MLHLGVIVFLAGFVLMPTLHAADADALEARLKDHVADSPEAAELMLQLLDAREAGENVFGVIRTAGDFVRAQSGHPRRAEVMVRLMEGYAAGARHGEVVATGKQFFELFPDDRFAPRAHRAMAEAYEELGRPHDAATHWAALGRGGDPLFVERALDGFRRAENAQAGREGAEFALAVLKQKPAEPWSAAVALRGMELAGRAEQWETGAGIGRAVAGRIDGAPGRELWFKLGEFESRLGRHAEAVKAMEKSLDRDPGRWDAMVRELGAAKAPPSELAKRAKELLEKFPGDRVTHEAAVRACEAYRDAGKPDDAAGFAEGIMAAGDFSRDLAIRYVEVGGDDHARAESFLKGQLGRFPARDSALREALAVDVYQNRLKDAARSRSEASD